MASSSSENSFKKKPTKKDLNSSGAGKDLLNEVLNPSDSPRPKKLPPSPKKPIRKKSGSSDSSPKSRSSSQEESKKVPSPKRAVRSRSSSSEANKKALVPVPVPEPDSKTFMTQKKEEEKQEAPWVLNDLLFPGGKIAKLCRVTNVKSKDIKVSDILKRSGIAENNPVILLSGAEGDKRAGLLVGIARAAYSTDAVIVDNGLKSGIETACYRKKVKLVGVCPEEAIVYPTKSSTGDRLGELAAGHSHLIVLGAKGDNMRWDNVVPFKMELCERIRKGRGGPGSFNCRGLCVLVGDSTACSWEVEKALKAGWPVLVLEASPLGRDVAAFIKGSASNVPKTLQEPLRKGKVFIFPESGTAEHLASAVHLHLAISF
jgi:hypothetical protein